MSVPIRVPELGESIVEATVHRWLKKEGESFAAGEALVEIETEKVNAVVSAERAGVLVKIERKEGEDVRVGDVLGEIDTSAAPAPTRAPPPSPAPTPAPPAKPASISKPEPVAPRRPPTPTPAPPAAPPAAPSPRAAAPAKSAAPAAPDAKAAPPAAPEPAPQAPAEERVRMSARRRTIARRLVEAQHSAAMLTTFNEVDMSRVMEIRRERKESFKERHGVGLGISSFFVKAAVAGLRAFPRLNAEVQGDEIVLKKHYDIGVAIGAGEGLVVPVLRGADSMSFAEIETAIKAYAGKAEQGSLTLDDLRGGTFTITNGGVFGSLLSTPILNPPEVGILGLHKIEDRPIASGGQVVVRPMMYVALSYDHRIVDGREAVGFLVRVKELVEEPEALLLDG